VKAGGVKTEDPTATAAKNRTAARWNCGREDAAMAMNIPLRERYTFGR
jgi:hypothetical protein